MDRDALLVAALGAAVVGCTAGREDDPAPVPTTPSPTPAAADVALLESWWRRERSLAASLPASYIPLRNNHLTRAAAVAEHLAALGAAPPSPPAPVPVADHAKAARDAAARYVAELTGAASADVAVLGAELAAGARQHAVVLAALAAPRPSGTPR